MPGSQPLHSRLWGSRRHPCVPAGGRANSGKPWCVFSFCPRQQRIIENVTRRHTAESRGRGVGVLITWVRQKPSVISWGLQEKTNGACWGIYYDKNDASPPSPPRLPQKVRSGDLQAPKPAPAPAWNASAASCSPSCSTDGAEQMGKSPVRTDSI